MQKACENCELKNICLKRVRLIQSGIETFYDCSTWQGWISVDDELPEEVEEERNNVLCYIVCDEYPTNNTCCVGEYYNGEWYLNIDEFYYYGRVTHWRALPELPKGEEDENCIRNSNDVC